MCSGRHNNVVELFKYATQLNVQLNGAGSSFSYPNHGDAILIKKRLISAIYCSKAAGFAIDPAVLFHSIKPCHLNGLNKLIPCT